ncbi:MAG: ATP-binding protein, partial [Pseudomonadota bacterium]
AGYAFMAMRERIKRHIGQRTDMLAGVSHDLRTPLTRLKLSLAMLPDSKDVAETRKDVDEMERMLDEYLAFVRNQSIEEETENVAMGPFLRQIAEQMHRAGRAVELGPVREMTADIRPAAVKRAVENLINNGARHAGHVWLSLKAVEGHLEIIIDDDGPGIPPDQYEEVFKLFTRLDEARNQNEGGVGLGLAMVRDIARGHGGSVSLSRAPQGGLRAVLRLPV